MEPIFKADQLLPKLIRLRDAPLYLGMDKNRFNQEVRSTLSTIPIGIQGVAFDRLELDNWADHYKALKGRPAQRSTLWKQNTEAYQGFSKGAKSGISTKGSGDSAFAKAVEALNLSKRKDF